MNNDSPEKKTRRSVLKSGAVMSAFAGVGGVASIGRAARGNGRATPPASNDHATAVSPKIIRGNRSTPVKKEEITSVRKTLFEELSASHDVPLEFAVSSNPKPMNDKLVGYGITVENGTLIEKIKTIPSDSTPPRSRSKQHRPDPLKTKSGLAEGKSIQDRVEMAHDELDQFKRKYKGGV